VSQGGVFSAACSVRWLMIAAGWCHCVLVLERLSAFADVDRCSDGDNCRASRPRIHLCPNLTSALNDSSHIACLKRVNRLISDLSATLSGDVVLSLLMYRLKFVSSPGFAQYFAAKSSPAVQSERLIGLKFIFVTVQCMMDEKTGNNPSSYVSWLQSFMYLAVCWQRWVVTITVMTIMIRNELLQQTQAQSDYRLMINCKFYLFSLHVSASVPVSNLK